MYYRQSFNASGAAADSAADVVLVVDESGSIYQKTLWIREVYTCIYTHCNMACHFLSSSMYMYIVYILHNTCIYVYIICTYM